MRMYQHDNKHYLFRDRDGKPQYATVSNDALVWHDTVEGVPFDEIRPFMVDVLGTSWAVPWTGVGQRPPAGIQRNTPTT